MEKIIILQGITMETFLENIDAIIEKRLKEKLDAVKSNLSSTRELSHGQDHRTQYPEEMNSIEAAEFLHTTVHNLYQWTAKRLIPHFKRGRTLVFKLSDLKNWRMEKVATIEELKSKAIDRRLSKGTL
jgi:Fe-S cluster assembly ATPase SufC